MKSRTQHNVHFLKATTPHQKVPGVQILRKEEILKLIEDAKKKQDCMPMDGEWIRQQYYNLVITEKEKELQQQEQKKEELQKKIRPVSASLPGGVRNQINAKIKRQEKAEMAKGRKLPKVSQKKSPEKLLDQVDEMCKSEGSDVYEEYLDQLDPKTKTSKKQSNYSQEELNEEVQSQGYISEEEKKIELEEEENLKQIERDDNYSEDQEQEEENERSTQIMKGLKSNQHSQIYASETANLLNDLLNEVSLE